MYLIFTVTFTFYESTHVVFFFIFFYWFFYRLEKMIIFVMVIIFKMVIFDLLDKYVKQDGSVIQELHWRLYFPITMRKLVK